MILSQRVHKQGSDTATWARGLCLIFMPDNPRVEGVQKPECPMFQLICNTIRRRLIAYAGQSITQANTNAITRCVIYASVKDGSAAHTMYTTSSSPKIFTLCLYANLSSILSMPRASS